MNNTYVKFPYDYFISQPSEKPARKVIVQVIERRGLNRELVRYTREFVYTSGHVQDLPTFQRYFRRLKKIGVDIGWVADQYWIDR